MLSWPQQYFQENIRHPVLSLTSSVMMRNWRICNLIHDLVVMMYMLVVLINAPASQQKCLITKWSFFLLLFPLYIWLILMSAAGIQWFFEFGYRWLCCCNGIRVRISRWTSIQVIWRQVTWLHIYMESDFRNGANFAISGSSDSPKIRSV